MNHQNYSSPFSDYTMVPSFKGGAARLHKQPVVIPAIPVEPGEFVERTQEEVMTDLVESLFIGNQ